MTESRELMIERAREFAQQHPKKTRIELGTDRPFDHWVVIMADFGIQAIERYKESLAKDARREENGKNHG